MDMQGLEWRDLVEADYRNRSTWIEQLGLQSKSDTSVIHTRIQVPGDHFLVRQGYKSAAVISAFQQNEQFKIQDIDFRRLLLSISFNTLSDWHILVQPTQLQIFFNRRTEETLIKADIQHSELQPNLLWKVLGIERDYIIHPDLDDITDSILRKIEFLKKQILGYPHDPNIDPHVIDHLLNAMIFLRFIEDYKKAEAGTTLNLSSRMESMLSFDFDRIITDILAEIGIAGYEKFLDIEQLAKIPPRFNRAILTWFKSFYRDNSQAQYEYDFSLIAEHALGQIYDKYVSLVTEPKHNGTLSFYPELDTSLSWQRGTGTLYTPEYIAQFMVKTILRLFPQDQRTTLCFADLACGSGIFIRNFLIELVKTQEGPHVITEDTLGNIIAADINKSAICAAKLTIALTIYKYAGRLIEGFTPENEDSLSETYAQKYRPNSIDLIVMNPPFIGWDLQNDNQRRIVREVLGVYLRKKPDYSLAFLKKALDLLRDGGCLAIILPASFLDSDSATKMRNLLVDSGEIWMILKFEDYTIFERGEAQIAILIYQKRQEKRPLISTRVLYCRNTPDLAIRALETESLESRPEWEYFIVDSSKWGESWPLLPLEVGNVMDRLRSEHPKLDDIFEIRQGIRIGHKKIFIIRDYHEVPKQERRILQPLADNDNIYWWRIQKDNRRLIFPYRAGKIIPESEMNSAFPSILARLSKHKSMLLSRARMSEKPYWSLMWPRDPEAMFGAKIVSTSFGLPGSYAYDAKGNFVVTNGNMLIPKRPFPDKDSWYFYLAILNSDLFFRFVARMSRKLKGGQYDLSNRYIKRIPIPRYETVDSSARAILIQAAKDATDGKVIPFGNELFQSALYRTYDLGKDEINIL